MCVFVVNYECSCLVDCWRSCFVKKEAVGTKKEEGRDFDDGDETSTKFGGTKPPTPKV